MRKGFTLIELLAVIVILAIIALIATPIVLSIIEDSKESSMLRNSEMYLDAVEYSVAKGVLNNITLENKAYNILPNGNICIKYEGSNCSKELEVEVKGETPISGTITLEDGVIKNHTLTYESNITIVDGSISSVDIPEAKSFGEDDWDVIAANVRAGNLSKYNVGDTKTIELDGFGTHTVRIANTSTPAECSTSGFSQTACGFVIEFVDIITKHAMNSTYTNVGGWESSLMRTYVNSTIYESLPEELKTNIIDTYVVSGHGSTSGETNFKTTDKIYLLATAEIWENGEDNQIDYDTARDLTRQLDYYSNLGVTTSNYSGAIKKLNGTANNWWLRSAHSYGTISFYGVPDYGDWRHYYASNTYGVAVAFRIG